MRPRSIALARTASTSMPLPSSAISMTIMLPSFEALRRTVPSSFLPAAARSSGDSMPWSRALRTECISGSSRSSITDLSSSVSSPSMTRLTFLLRVLVRSRTSRGKRLNIWLMGTMRMRMTPSCSSPVMRPRFCAVERNLATSFLRSVSKPSKVWYRKPYFSTISFLISLADLPCWIAER